MTSASRRAAVQVNRSLPLGILDGVAAADSASYPGDRLHVLAGAWRGIFADIM